MIARPRMTEMNCTDTSPHLIFNEALLADRHTPLALACICDLPVPLCNLYHLENSERKLEGNRNLESVNR